MSKKTFEHYINLVIVDASISVSNKTDFSTYKTFAHFISQSIDSKNYGAIESYIFPILNEVCDILSIPVKESAEHVARFFKNKKWVTYHPPIKAIKDEFNIFLVP